MMVGRIIDSRFVDNLQNALLGRRIEIVWSGHGLKRIDGCDTATVPDREGGQGVLIEVREVEKVYQVRQGTPVRALTDVNLTIRAGEFVSVVGPSGCGKSTLMRILAGLDVQSRGTVTINGRANVGPRPDVGVVFQQATLLPWKTVLENVMLPATLRGIDRTERAKQLLDLVSLSGFSEKYPFELSGGMQQRVAICRALVCDPDILLMDEPFGALDAITREQMNIELARIQAEQKKTIVFITHSIPEAVFLGDRVVVMSARPGRISELIDVDIPRPRTLETMALPGFGALCAKLRYSFAADATAAHL
ncbi:MAG: ABC transporter ATP-binding protein [Xanthobacteraceae bacterium]